MARYRFHDARDHFIGIPDGQGGVTLSLRHPISPLGVRFRDGHRRTRDADAERRQTLMVYRPEHGDRLELEETGDNGSVALILISKTEPDMAGTTPPTPLSSGPFKLPGSDKPWAKGNSAVTTVTDSQPAMLRKQNQAAKDFWR